MKELEKIVDSNGTPMEIVDAEARADISEIKQSLSQSSTQFDAATGVTKIATNMGKAGALATIALTLQKVFVSQNTSVTMGTLPSGYRPSYVVCGACRNETKGTTLGFTIETNGDVKVQTNTTTVDSAAQNIMINASFMV